MNNNNLDQHTPPKVRIDKSLNKYKGKVIFKKKLERAKETLKRVGLPKLDASL